MYVAEALTPLLRLGTFSWIVTRNSHQKNSQFPTLVVAHQAEVRGPPVGRGPQVENRCSRQFSSCLGLRQQIKLFIKDAMKL